MKHLLTLAVTSLLATTAFADPIHSAVWNGDLEGVQAELDNGVDVDEKDDLWGRTPLHIAAEEGHKEIAELLIAKGADVNAKDSVGFTPLHEAAFYGQNEIAELLIAKGADVNAKDDNFVGTPLNRAAWKGHKEVVELLIDNGADVNAKSDWFERTPLHDAIWEGRKEVIELLIAKGADVNAKDDYGKTPLDWAEKVNEADSPELKAAKKEIADLLRKHQLNQLMPRLVQHGRFAFSFDAKEGKVYEVQDSFDLLNWEPIRTYTGAGDTVRFDEDRDHDPPQWFYRVKMVE